ncbi:MAG: acetylxylan esterase, partial [Deltaproteobacteria bacterium]|nr:acetylxylan esterase [Deltaproteobacteria bacterium]
ACSDGSEELGAACVDNSECEGDLVCAGGTCREPGTQGPGEFCSASRDCDDGLYCSLAGVCAEAGDGDVGDACFTAGECQAGLVCQFVGFGGVCQEAGDGDIGDTCSSNLDCIAGLACGNDDTCQSSATAFPPFQGAECEPDETIFKAYFELPKDGSPPADFYRTPFPSDARVDADGNLDLSDFPVPGKLPIGVDLVDLYRNALVQDFTGFSTQAAVAFRFSRDLDFDSVDPNAGGTAPVMVDITNPADPRRLSIAFGYRGDRRLYHCQHYFTVRSTERQPLEAGHTYAVYLTTDIRGLGDQQPVVDNDLTLILAASRPTGPLGHAWDQHLLFRQYLAGESIGANTIATVASFTVLDPTERMGRVIAAAEAAPAPVLSELTECDSGVASPCEADGARSCSIAASDPDMREIHGRFSIPIFQQGDAPYLDSGGAINEPGGTVTQVGTQDVCFAMTVPTGAVGPLPLVVYAHGTGGTSTGVISNGVARALATASTPMATLSYDGVVHGDRRGGVDIDPDNLMFNVLNPPAARDNNAQGAVDVIAALRIADLGTITAGGLSVDIDPDNVFYFGHSQGSNVGIPAIALTDRVAAAVFSGAGGFLTQSLLSKTSPVDVPTGLSLVLGEELATSHPVMVLWQTYFDPVDTTNYGPLLYQTGDVPKHVLMTWGIGDTYSADPTLESMAESALLGSIAIAGNEPDLPEVVRPISGNVTGQGNEPITAVVIQYQPDDYDGHFVAQRNPQAVADWTAFLTSALDGAVPTIP